MKTWPSIQYNKRDLQEEGIPILSVEALEKDLNKQLNVPSFEACALKGTNVVTTLKKIISQTMASIQKEMV